MKTIKTGITNVPATISDPHMRLFLQQVKASIEHTTAGVSDLAANVLKIPTGADIPAPSLSTLALDYFPPTAITGFTITGLFTGVFFTWNSVFFPGATQQRSIAFVEIWRGTTNNIASAVLQIVTKSDAANDPIHPAEVFYYWVRGVTSGGIPGPFNSILGTIGTAANINGGYLLADSITDAQIAATGIGISKVTGINGAYVLDKIGIGGIAGTYIANAAITDAKIANLAVGKVTGITSSFLLSNIGIGNITDAYIQNATISSAKIASLAVDKVVGIDSTFITARITTAFITDAHINTLTVDTILGDVSRTYSVTQGGAYTLYAGIARAIGTIVIPTRSQPQGLAVYVEGTVSTGNVAIVAEFYELFTPSLADVIASWTMTSQMLFKSSGQLEYISTTEPPSAMSGIQIGEKLTITGDGSTTFLGTVSGIVNTGSGGTYVTTISFSEAVLVGSIPSSGLICRRYPSWKVHATKIAVSISSYAPSSSSYSAAGYDTGSRLTLGRIIYCTLRAAGAVATYTKVTIVAGR